MGGREKMKNFKTILVTTIALTLICVITAAALGFTNELTAKRIAEVEKKAEQEEAAKREAEAKAEKEARQREMEQRERQQRIINQRHRRMKREIENNIY